MGGKIINLGPLWGPQRPEQRAAPMDPGLKVKLSRTRFTRKGVLERPMIFQCAPLDEFGWDAAFNWIDYDTVDGDQYTRRGGKQLRTLTLNSLVMDWSAPWAVQQLGHRERRVDPDDYYGMGKRPEKVAQRLDWLVEQGTPFMLTVTNPRLYKRPDFRHIVTLRSASLKERAGEPDARYFDLGFTEYRTPRIQRRRYGDRHELPATIEVNRHGVCTEIRRDHEKLPKRAQHTIGKPGRPATLRMLAKHYYGSPRRWELIQIKNGLTRPEGALQSFHGDTPLDKLFEKRKRKNQPIRLIIPTLDFTAPTGGVSPPKRKAKK